MTTESHNQKPPLQVFKECLANKKQAAMKLNTNTTSSQEDAFGSKIYSSCISVLLGEKQFTNVQDFNTCLDTTKDGKLNYDVISHCLDTLLCYPKGHFSLLLSVHVDRPDTKDEFFIDLFNSQLIEGFGNIMNQQSNCEPGQEL